jgi:hypothetical protein
MKKQIALAVVFALSASGVALATSQEEEQACTNDAFQFCQNFIPDRNRVFTCLVGARDQISAACHTVLAPYLPADPVVTAASVKKPPAPQKPAAKSKAPLSLTPH